MCGPVQQMSIAPKKAKSISQMKEYCNECPLRVQPDEKEVHLQLGKDDNEYS